MADTAFALVLNLHQPAGNLEDLLEQREWEAAEIVWAMDRIPRSLWAYEDVGRVHLSLSGTLLETLASPGFQRRVYGIIDCGSLLWYLQNTTIIRILGTGYYHPVLPLIPHADWDEQLERWHGVGQHLFARTSFPGFWPPEMGFCMELMLEEAHWRVLRAETSCNFFWGDTWLQRCHDDLNQATRFLNQARSRLASHQPLDSRRP